MFMKLLLITIIQLCLSRTLFCVHFPNEVDTTSMDTTHYDRRLLEQQCSINEPMKKPQLATYLAFPKSLSAVSTNNNNASSNSTSLQRQFTISYEEDQLVTRTLGIVDVNNRNPLKIDEASLDIIIDKQITTNLSAYVQIVECVDCPYKILSRDLSSNKPLNLTFNTKYNYRIRIEFNEASSCLENISLYEHGQYILSVQMSSPSSGNSSNINPGLTCTLATQRAANNTAVPLIIGGVILLILFITCVVAQRLKVREHLLRFKRRFEKQSSPEESTHSYNLKVCSPVTTTETTITTCVNSAATKLPPIPKISNVIVPRSKRLLSLDAFRGFALIAMIFVNYGGGRYAQFEHVPWHGITFADIVFPFFVWILGTSMVISLKNSSDKHVPKRTVLKKVATRTIKLFLIGFILNTRFKVDLTEVRIPGVLQRFAIVYAVVATIEVLCARPKQYLVDIVSHSSTPTVKTGVLQRLRIMFSDIINFPLQWLINIGLALIWILVVYLVPFENCPAGYLGPGGLHENGKYENCTGGITGYIDRVIFTGDHIYKYPTCQAVFGCKIPFDPENLLGALPTMSLAYLGVQAGRILVMYENNFDRLIRLVAWSIVTTAIGVGLTLGTLYDGPMPLNKNIWTLSFSFFTAGLAFAGFSIMYIFIDLLKWWSGTPLQYPGTNSTLIYISHLVFATYFPVQWLVAETHAAQLAMNLWGCVFWIIVAYIFFKKRIFLVL